MLNSGSATLPAKIDQVVPRYPCGFSEGYYRVREILLREVKHELSVTLGLPVTQAAEHVFQIWGISFLIVYNQTSQALRLADCANSL